jgi:outer membrane protein TolC
MILLIGLVSKNSILLVTYASDLRDQGHDAPAAMREAGRIRLRPILMTSVAAIFGALPIALGLGAGAGSRRPLGYAIIGGLTVSTLLTLYLVPAVFVVLERVRRQRVPSGAPAPVGSHLAMMVVCAGAVVAAAPSRLAAQGAGDRMPVVTLEEARRRAVAVDPIAVAARADEATAAWERRAARIDLLTPNLTAGTSYLHFSDPFFNFGTGNISPNATSATLEASYTLLGAGKLGELKRSRASLQSAEANETAARFGVALATDAAYFSVLADRELSRVAQERLRRAEEQFGIARVRVLAGEAIAPDSLQLLLEMNRARLAILRQDSALTVSRLRLGRRIGLPGPADAAPADTTMPPELPVTEEEAVREMRASSPEVEAARAAERRASAVLGIEREGYLPDISLGATTGAYDSEFFPSALRRTQLAVTMSLPLWDRGRRELAVARARAERGVAVAERQERERAAAERMAEAYHGYQTARAAIELALVGVTVATENYRVQRARYREGATTILDLLEAQVSLSEAEATLVQSRYASWLALARIEALLGRRIFEDTPGTSSGNR